MNREFSFSRLVAWLTAGFLALPVFIMLPISFTPNRYLSLPDGEISFRHYASLINDPLWLSSITDSFIVAVCATTLALFIGGAFATGVWRRGGLTQSILQPIMLAPMIVPPIVHSVAFYKGWAAVGLLDTYIGVILVHAIKGAPFVILTVGASLANIDPRTEQAARSLGASASRSMCWVVIPQIKAGLVAGGTFAFFISWDEIIVAMFITMRKVYTLPRRIWDGLGDNIDPAIAALGTVMIFIMMIIMIYLVRKGDQKTSKNQAK